MQNDLCAWLIIHSQNEFTAKENVDNCDWTLMLHVAWK